MGTLYENADMFDELPFWSAPFGLKLLNAVPCRKNLTVLDIGCGTGFPLVELAMRMGASCRLYGIDPWNAALVRLQKKLSCHKVKNVTAIDGCAESLPLLSETVDLVISNNGINNVSDIPVVFGECFRVLKPNGQFIFTFNTDRTTAEFYGPLEEALVEAGVPDVKNVLQKHINERRPDIGYLRCLLDSCGFADITVDDDRFTYRFSDAAAIFTHGVMASAFLPSWLKLIPEPLHDVILKRVTDR